MILHFDGAAWPNPGGTATFGWTLVGGAGARIGQGSGVAATGAGATNNVAEWVAFREGLEWVRASDLDPAGLTVRGDSRLVVEQFNGTWACRAPHLAEYRDGCRKIVAGLELAGWTVTVEWVLRDRNAAADALSAEAYQKATGKRLPDFKKGR